MKLDFRKLSRMDQIKAIQNIIDTDSEAIPYLAFIISNSQFNVGGWFDFSQSNEGYDYWGDLNAKQRKENDSEI